MTQRERMLTTLKHGKADRVPCCPDISIMVPLKMKNRPFWSFYIDERKDAFDGLYDNENLLNAYIDACRHFGTVAWAWYLNPVIGERKTRKDGKVRIVQQGDVSYRSEIVDCSASRVVVRTTMVTPDGELWSETVYPDDNPPFPVRKFLKSFKEDFKFLRYFYPPLDVIDFSPVLKERELVGDMGTNMIAVAPPSLVHLDNLIDGGLGAIGLAYYDYPDLMARYKEMHERWIQAYLEKVLAARCCDEIQIGVSGLATWQSPEITKKLSLDGIRLITRICKEHGMTTHLHCCGFERKLVHVCAEETDLDVIEPLEPPPQGDCDLGELKRKYGKKLVLKGNLHTSSVMLSDVGTVEREAIRCIENAAEGGGFILSTGDQCGRDTPHENIFKLVEVCERYGVY